MFRRRVQTVACSFATALILCASAFAQARIGTIQGTVKDPNGAVVPNAKVTVTQSVTGYNQTAQADADGAFKLVNVPFNTYTVRAEAPGFQGVEQAVDLESGIPVQLDLALAVAGTAETVTVTSGGRRNWRPTERRPTRTSPKRSSNAPPAPPLRAPSSR